MLIDPSVLRGPANGLHADASGVLMFELQEPTPMLNELLRMHWQKARQNAARLAGLVRLATHGRRPAEPWERARLVVVRRSIRDVDQDGAVGGLKPLIDCLLPPGKPYIVKRGNSSSWACKYPYGLSIIRDDGPGHLTLEVTCQRVASRREQGTSLAVHRES